MYNCKCIFNSFCIFLLHIKDLVPANYALFDLFHSLAFPYDLTIQNDILPLMINVNDFTFNKSEGGTVLRDDYLRSKEFHNDLLKNIYIY